MLDARDFHRRFAQAERRARIIRALVLAHVAIVNFALLGAAAILVATVIRLGPEGLAREAGRLMAIVHDGYARGRGAP